MDRGAIYDNPGVSRGEGRPHQQDVAMYDYARQSGKQSGTARSQPITAAYAARGSGSLRREPSTQQQQDEARYEYARQSRKESHRHGASVQRGQPEAAYDFARQSQKELRHHHAGASIQRGHPEDDEAMYDYARQSRKESHRHGASVRQEPAYDYARQSRKQSSGPTSVDRHSSAQHSQHGQQLQRQQITDDDLDQMYDNPGASHGQERPQGAVYDYATETEKERQRQGLHRDPTYDLAGTYQDGGDAYTDDVAAMATAGMQHATFKNWVHFKLTSAKFGGLDKSVTLGEQLSSGIALCNLLSALSGERLIPPRPRPETPADCELNVNEVFRFLQTWHVNIGIVEPNDIVYGNKDHMLSLIWYLIRHFTIFCNHKRSSPCDKKASEIILEWVHSNVVDVPVNNFSTSWRDGLAITRLVNTLEPSAIEFPPTLDYPLDRVEKALDVAETHLGVPKLVQPGFIARSDPDTLSILTYLGELRGAVMDDAQLGAEQSYDDEVTTENSSRVPSQHLSAMSSSQSDGHRSYPGDPRQYRHQGSRQAPQKHRGEGWSYHEPRQYEDRRWTYQQERQHSQQRQSQPRQPSHSSSHHKQPQQPRRSQRQPPPQPHPSQNVLASYQGHWESQGRTQQALRAQEDQYIYRTRRVERKQYEIGLKGWEGRVWQAPHAPRAGRSFPVNVAPSGIANHLGLHGPAWLQITALDVAILDQMNPEKVYVAFPLNHILRFGEDKDILSIEVGSLDRFAGTFYFCTSRNKDAFGHLNRVTRAW